MLAYLFANLLSDLCAYNRRIVITGTPISIIATDMECMESNGDSHPDR